MHRIDHAALMRPRIIGRRKAQRDFERLTAANTTGMYTGNK